MDEKYALKWNDFQSNITNSFIQLRDSTDFQDVTLVSDDLVPISAHKVVLSSGSKYFRNILKLSANSHSYLCLNGTSSSDLQNVLDFVYSGEVRIYQDEVDRFMLIAQRFELEGLLVKESEEKIIDKEINSLNNYKILMSKQEEINAINPIANVDASKILVKADFQSIEEMDMNMQKYIESSMEGHQCTICRKTSKHSGHIREHVETHLEGLSYSCHKCGNKYNKRGTFRKHLKFC